jgi:hypothetical protein
METADKSKKRRYPKFANFGEYLFYAYANFQMLIFAIKNRKPKYDRSCFMLRAKAFKAYKEGQWEIHDLYDNVKWKMQWGSDYCWYCLKEVTSSHELTADHILPRSKGGDNSMDNLVLVCKACNSSKNNMDLIEWFIKRRGEIPYPYIFAHYYKLIYQYAKKNNLLDMHRDELEKMVLPFNPNYVLFDFPDPDYYYNFTTAEDENKENSGDA